MDMATGTDTAKVPGPLGAGALLADPLQITSFTVRAAEPRRAREFAVTPDLRVCVVGLGYIGLPTASLLGTKGARVFGVDISPEVVATINSGRIHIVEPDLDLMVKSAVQGGRLSASLAPVAADVFILAVPTPILPDKRPDLTAVRAAAKSIATVLAPGNLVILESTSPVGTTEEIVAAILSEAGHDVGGAVLVAYCPERVLPGRILTELIENDRVVGGINEASTEAAVSFYQSFVRGEVVATDARTAEMVKLTENSFRDVNIAFANELSMICAREDISVWEVIRLANRHPRVKILSPGPGVGGHCIAVDPWFIVARSPAHAPLIRTAREVNDRKPHWVIERVMACAAQVKRPVIACLGLSFKADVDDLRESPAVDIVRALQRERAGELLVVEPHLAAHAEFPLVRLEEAVARANIVLVLVDHKQFRRLRRESLHEKLLIDTRGLFL
jgi:UDP-N-acetyl-D-mannosaminuronic acid dehydrogenase